ncbi:hypothetical protein H1164_08200 [Thermoactinomyces daqus]|uniref:Uncharacterized protein n=1 Tax=Thermoactinomyces daqus TaxID=1329516 RepID=A0A7W2AHM0_9BACL|nr:BhlA/UviB family holin-like peptide [Thermoactinomyces daqus]MBA4542881.1 hypothetical protein [Thermoactinomyces daqus]
MEVLLDIVKNNGVWATLFVFLLLYTLRQAEKREEKLMNFIDEMSDNFEKLSWNLEKLAEDVDKIREKVSGD